MIYLQNCLLDKPIVEVSPTLEETGNNVTINCSVTTKLNSTTIDDVQWLRNGSNLNTTNGEKYSGGTVATPSLSIQDLGPDDGGKYVCVASNQFGTTNSKDSVTLGKVIVKAWNGCTKGLDDLIIMY